MNALEGNGDGWVGVVDGLGYGHGKPPHEIWDEALDRAIDQVPEDAPAELKVETYAIVKHSSPGWLDGFKVILRP